MTTRVELDKNGDKARVFHRPSPNVAWTHPYDAKAECKVCSPGRNAGVKGNPSAPRPNPGS